MLVDLFCRTVAVDMRGYGESDKPCGIWEYKLDKLVDDVNQLITELGLFFFFGFSQLNKITLWAEQDKFIFQYQHVFCYWLLLCLHTKNRYMLSYHACQDEMW